MCAYVDCLVTNKEQVVAVGKVEEVEANGREAENEGSNDCVTDANDEQGRVDGEAVAVVSDAATHGSSGSVHRKLTPCRSPGWSG